MLRSTRCFIRDRCNVAVKRLSLSAAVIHGVVGFACRLQTIYEYYKVILAVYMKNCVESLLRNLYLVIERIYVYSVIYNRIIYKDMRGGFCERNKGQYGGRPYHNKMTLTRGVHSLRCIIE